MAGQISKLLVAVRTGIGFLNPLVELEKELTAAASIEQQVEDLTGQLARVQAEYSDVSKQLSDVKAELGRLQKDHEKEKTDVRLNLKKEFDAAKTAHKKILDEMEMNKVKVEKEFSDFVTQNLEQRKKIEAETITLEAKRAELEKTIESLRQDTRKRIEEALS